MPHQQIFFFLILWEITATGKGSELGEQEGVMAGEDSPKKGWRGECIAVGSMEDALTVQQGRKEQFLDKTIGLPRQPHCLLVGKLEDFRGKVL